ncbi:flotillin [Desulfonema ishimotonii]|uniref:Flotillin n=1 Tax=Desulfonema ishimotonii TaxID=45657 RepID=A0A401G454_9BACT|nr:flotillin family protein [Desulfonema ishimotonii]GBC63905.1 flotillin [Desulfonema ishimotonii]
MELLAGLGFTGIVVLFVIGLGFITLLAKFYRKVEQGHALVRNGIGGTKVSFSGTVVVPILHKAEEMDISVKRVIIDRHGSEGLICRDNMRADIKVVFFVRVNKTSQDVLKVAQAVGCERASHPKALQELFEAKFSEALKTVGKQFEFVELYNSREQFKEEMLKVIGTDLNGFVMDDAAIDYLEQTPLEMLNADNILDSQGIKKITELTSDQKILANKIDRDREKTITRQDVEAKEAVLELNRQLAEAESRQKREVEIIQARETAETVKVQQEERLKAESARISSEEEIQVAEENKDRQIIVARKNKERTDAIESERLEKDRMIEATERERIVALTQIEKNKAIEVERKNIQDVIRERVKVEKTVVEEQQRIKDTEAFAEADREKRVAITQAEKSAEETEVVKVKGAEAARQVAALKAEEDMLRTVKDAEAAQKASDFKARQAEIEAGAFFHKAEKEAAAKKMLAEADAAEKAAQGMSDVQVMEARAAAIEKEGAAQSKVMDLKYQAESGGIEKKGTAEAKVQSLKFQAEAKGIEQKANAMKLLDGVGREHEEFKLRLHKEKDVEIAEIRNRGEVARYQADILAQALRSAKIDIVGGEATFFDRIVNAISTGKAVDRYVDNSKTLTDVKETFFNSDPEYFQSQLKHFFKQFGITSEDVKNLTVSAVLGQLVSLADKPEDRSALYELLSMAERSGMAKKVLGK